MNQLSVLYFEETEELLQKVEFLLIALESNYSNNEINELFRVVHSIKGSSQMMGYEQIGNLTHKIEDMLDKVRNHALEMNNEVLHLCFEGFDLVKDMFESHRRSEEAIPQVTLTRVKKIEHHIDQVLLLNSQTILMKKPMHEANNQEGIISKLIKMPQSGLHRYLIEFNLSEDTQMKGVTLFMVINSIKDICTIVYTNVTNEEVSGLVNDNKVLTYEILLSTDLDKAELYPYFENTYIDKVTINEIGRASITNLPLPHKSSIGFYEVVFEVFTKLNKVFFGVSPIVINAEFNRMLKEQKSLIEDAGLLLSFDSTIQFIQHEITLFLQKYYQILHKKKTINDELRQLLCLEFDRLFKFVYESIKGGRFIRNYKVKHTLLIDNLNDFVSRLDKSITSKLIIDATTLEEIGELELRGLINLKRELKSKNISLSIVVSPLSKKIINVIESIESIEMLSIFYKEKDAVLSS